MEQHLPENELLCDGGFDLKGGVCKMWEETSKIQVVEPQEVLSVSCRGDSGDTRFTVTRLPHPTRDKSDRTLKRMDYARFWRETLNVQVVEKSTDY
jgi:hypothetical protein